MSTLCYGDKYFMQKVNPGFLQLAEVICRPPTTLPIDWQDSLNELFILHNNQCYTLLLFCIVQYDFLLEFATKYVTSFTK